MKKQILDYLKLVSKTLKEIRKTPKFAEEFSNGDLSEYYSIEERLKLSTEHGDKLDLEQTYQWIEKNKVR